MFDLNGRPACFDMLQPVRSKVKAALVPKSPWKNPGVPECVNCSVICVVGVRYDSPEIYAQRGRRCEKCWRQAEESKAFEARSAAAKFLANHAANSIEEAARDMMSRAPLIGLLDRERRLTATEACLREDYAQIRYQRQKGDIVIGPDVTMHIEESMRGPGHTATIYDHKRGQGFQANASKMAVQRGWLRVFNDVKDWVLELEHHEWPRDYIYKFLNVFLHRLGASHDQLNEVANFLAERRKAAAIEKLRSCKEFELIESDDLAMDMRGLMTEVVCDGKPWLPGFFGKPLPPVVAIQRKCATGVIDEAMDSLSRALDDPKFADLSE